MLYCFVYQGRRVECSTNRNFTPYKTDVVQELQNSDKVNGVEFRRLILEVRKKSKYRQRMKKNITSSVYDCTVEDVEYSRHLVVVITLP